MLIRRVTSRETMVLPYLGYLSLYSKVGRGSGGSFRFETSKSCSSC